MPQADFFSQAITRFFSTAETQTLGAGVPEVKPAPAGTLIRPVMRAAALAAAMTGGLVLEAKASTPSGPSPELLTMSASAARRAPLVIDEAGAFARAGIRVVINDIRLGSPDFAATNPEETSSTAAFSTASSRANRVAPGEELRDGKLVLLTPSDAAGSCQVIIGGVESKLTPPQLAAAMASLPSTYADRLSAPIFSRPGVFDAFIVRHEVGHCRDGAFSLTSQREAEDGGMRSSTLWRNKMETFADIVGAVEMLQAPPRGLDTAEALQAVRELAAVRTLGVANGFRSAAVGAPADPVTSLALAYDTAPGILALLDRVRDEGRARLFASGSLAAAADPARADAEGVRWLRGLSHQEVNLLAGEIRDETKMTEARHDALMAGLTDARVRPDSAGAVGYRFTASMPRDFAARFQEASRLLDFKPVSLLMAADRDPTRTDNAARPSPVLDLPGMEVARRALFPDLAAGAVATSAQRDARGTITVAFREPGGEETKAAVSPRGDVTRFDAMGGLSSISISRPAMVRGGERTDAFTDGGNTATVSRAEAERRLANTFRAPGWQEAARRPPAPIAAFGTGVFEALKTDFLAGGEAISARREKDSVRVLIQDRLSQERYSVLIGTDGSVSRYDAQGRLASRSVDMPAVTNADASVRHMIVENGRSRAATAIEVLNAASPGYPSPPDNQAATAPPRHPR